MRDADLYSDLSDWVKSRNNSIMRLMFRMLQFSQMLTRGDDVGVDLWHVMAGDARHKQKQAEQSGKVKISATMRMYVNRQTVASCAFSEILSSVILLSLALGEHLTNTKYITHSRDSDSAYSERIVMTYALFLFAQLFGLLVSHNILEYKARLQLPQGKKRHVHVVAFEGMSHDMTQAAEILVTCLRGSFLSMFVERNAHKMAAQSDEASVLRRIDESCAVVLVVGAGCNFSPGTAARQRIGCALERGVPVTVVTADEEHDTIDNALQSTFAQHMQQQLQLETLGSGVKPVADQITKVVDQQLERAEAKAGKGHAQLAQTHTADRRGRGLTLSEQRAVERKVEVRGGLAAVMRLGDPHITFKLCTACTMMLGMAYQTLNGGKFASYDGSGDTTGCG